MIREKAQGGKNAYAIGKELGISKNITRKYIEREEDSPPEAERFSKLDAYKPQLRELMHQGVFNCVVLLERLRAAGYSGGITILKEYVHPYRPTKALPAVRRYETPAGKQAQMDWGICHYTDSSGTLHKVPAFVMILGKSVRTFRMTTIEAGRHHRWVSPAGTSSESGSSKNSVLRRSMKFPQTMKTRCGLSRLWSALKYMEKHKNGSLRQPVYEGLKYPYLVTRWGYFVAN